MKISISKLIIGAVAAASLATGLAVFVTSVAPEAKAESAPPSSVHQPSAKGDRLPILSTGSACSVQAWPNYDRICQFDMRSITKDARSVRIIALR
jgi:hypothetical protein